MAQRTIDDDELWAAQSLGWAARRAGADYLFARVLGDGRAVYLLEMIGGNVRLAIGDAREPYYDDEWCYQRAENELGWRAALGWDGEGEPDGWSRHPYTGRRRPGGDATKEYVWR